MTEADVWRLTNEVRQGLFLIPDESLLSFAAPPMGPNDAARAADFRFIVTSIVDRALRHARASEEEGASRIVEKYEPKLPAPSCHCGNILTDRSLIANENTGWLLLGQCTDHGPMAMIWNGKQWEPMKLAFESDPNDQWHGKGETSRG